MRLAIALLILILLPSNVWAESRIALVIGNKNYKAGVGALENPLNDIRLVRSALEKTGFEVLAPVENATRAVMLRAIHTFATKLSDAGSDAVGFLYYSGHGVASQGENYLVPVDVEEPSSVELSVQAVKQSEVLDILRNEAGNAAHYVVLDACRNNLKGARGGKGFVAVAQQSGVLIAFSTEPGKTASDSGQGSGPYATALAAELVKPDQNDLLMFHNVRVAVSQKTHGDQVPWTEDGIQRPVRLQFAAAAVKPGDGPQTPPIASLRLSEAREAWDSVKDTTNISILEAFASRYNDTFYAELARVKAEELKKQVETAIQPLKRPPQPPSEADRDADSVRTKAKSRTEKVTPPMPVTIGDTYDRIKAAYKISQVPVPYFIDGKPEGKELQLSDLGIWFFLNDANEIKTIRLDKPFAGSVAGIKIGDTREKVISVLGQPDRVIGRSERSGAFIIKGMQLRFDINGRLATIFL